MEVLELADVGAWEAWLEAHHGDDGEAWLRIAKLRSPLEVIRIGDALDGALCFGWIDGRRQGLDGDSFLQRYSPRRPRSPWSKVNRAKAEALIAAGRMRPAGLAQIEAARADGRWDRAYEPQRTAAVPAELAAALTAHPAAQAAFDSLGRSEQYALFLPLLKAPTPRSREQIVARVLAELGSA
ncbi:YdeI family protein [Promicromonospora sp. NPDC057138]|uniref:YdeI/OmpD-associated family protein n=1 Tax=Promicromonospora sp. NPDC057138 TaxID=3346031 RepID=UPI00363A222C